MKAWKAKCGQLNEAKKCIQRKLVLLEQRIEDHFILQNLGEDDAVAKFPISIVEILQLYTGNKQCSQCHNVYPIEVQQCVLCHPKVHCAIQLHGKLLIRNNRFQFQDHRDCEVWQYFMQFANERSYTYEYHCSGKAEDAEVISFHGDTLLDQRYKYVSMSLKLKRAGWQNFSQFHELVSKKEIHTFRKQKFEYPWPFDESTRYNRQI